MKIFQDIGRTIDFVADRTHPQPADHRTCRLRFCFFPNKCEVRTLLRLWSDRDADLAVPGDTRADGKDEEQEITAK